MIALLQRVREAEVEIEGALYSRIGPGILVLLGIEEQDGDEDVAWLVPKIIRLRIFDDDDGVMNRSLEDAGGRVLVVSQFTLHASTKKGTRPSYSRAARPEWAEPLYQRFVSALRLHLGEDRVATGCFGAAMLVRLTNDGPVTIPIDSKRRV